MPAPRSSVIVRTRAPRTRDAVNPLPLLLLSLFAGCVPTRHASLSIPLSSLDGRSHTKALVELDLAELARRMDGFDPLHLGIYTRGRTPEAIELVDRDRDGRPDLACCTSEVAADGSTRILAVCPAEPTFCTIAREGLPLATPIWEKSLR